MHIASRANDIDGPAESAIRQREGLLRRNRQQIPGEHGSPSLCGLAECLKRGLGHVGVGKDDRTAGGSQGSLDRRNLGGRHLDE